MGTTSLGIPYPENTDLVKDGAADMQALAEAANDLYGLVHIQTTTFSASSAESFNNVFTSTYDAYKFVIRGSASTALSVLLRFRTSGSDNSTSNYSWSGLQTNSNTATLTSIRGAASSFTALHDAATNSNFTIECFIMSPNLSERTLALSQSVSSLNNTTHWSIGHEFTATTVFDGFTVYPSTGNITGSISIFGVKK